MLTWYDSLKQLESSPSWRALNQYFFSSTCLLGQIDVCHICHKPYAKLAKDMFKHIQSSWIWCCQYKSCKKLPHASIIVVYHMRCACLCHKLLKFYWENILCQPFWREIVLLSINFDMPPFFPKSSHGARCIVSHFQRCVHVHGLVKVWWSVGAMVEKKFYHVHGIHAMHSIRVDFKDCHPT